eukprot:scaffold17713_cov112-Isochrysis_galbana.AAC.1
MLRHRPTSLRRRPSPAAGSSHPPQATSPNAGGQPARQERAGGGRDASDTQSTAPSQLTLRTGGSTLHPQSALSGAHLEVPLSLSSSTSPLSICLSKPSVMARMRHANRSNGNAMTKSLARKATQTRAARVISRIHTRRNRPLTTTSLANSSSSTLADAAACTATASASGSMPRAGVWMARDDPRGGSGCSGPWGGCPCISVPTSFGSVSPAEAPGSRRKWAEWSSDPPGPKHCSPAYTRRLGDEASNISSISCDQPSKCTRSLPCSPDASIRITLATYHVPEQSRASIRCPSDQDGISFVESSAEDSRGEPNAM